jgi:hypothetical protein
MVPGRRFPWQFWADRDGRFKPRCSGPAMSAPHLQIFDAVAHNNPAPAAKLLRAWTGQAVRFSSERAVPCCTGLLLAGISASYLVDPNQAAMGDPKNGGQQFRRSVQTDSFHPIPVLTPIKQVATSLIYRQHKQWPCDPRTSLFSSRWLAEPHHSTRIRYHRGLSASSNSPIAALNSPRVRCGGAATKGPLCPRHRNATAP